MSSLITRPSLTVFSSLNCTAPARRPVILTVFSTSDHSDTTSFYFILFTYRILQFTNNNNIMEHASTVQHEYDRGKSQKGAPISDPTVRIRSA